MRVFLVLAVVGTVALTALAGSAPAAPDCRTQVIADWSDNGRIDGVYPLECYENAIESIPPEIRDYTDAPETIGRALTLAVREKRSETPLRTVASGANVDTSRTVTFPLPLLALGVLGAFVIAGGGLAYARRRADRGDADGSR
jgi:hypothetical protein